MQKPSQTLNVYKDAVYSKMLDKIRRPTATRRVEVLTEIQGGGLAPVEREIATSFEQPILECVVRTSRTLLFDADGRMKVARHANNPKGGTVYVRPIWEGGDPKSATLLGMIGEDGSVIKVDIAAE